MPGFLPLHDLTDARVLSLLEDSDFSFNMRGWKGDAADFFAPTKSREAILAERKRLLQGPERDFYTGALPSAGESLAEAAALAAGWTGQLDSPRDSEIDSLHRALGSFLEPDFILLAASGEKSFRAVAGAVCFPSSWDFRHALGKRVHEIHGIVPGLNEAVGARIELLLEKLPPGETWTRMNWGVSLSERRNQHPSQDIPRLRDTANPSDAWLRVELQALHKLPRSGAILFGIYPVSISFDVIPVAPATRAALKRQLDSMPPEMRDYKGIGDNTRALDRWLG